MGCFLKDCAEDHPASRCSHDATPPQTAQEERKESVLQRCEALGDAVEGVLREGGMNRLEAIILAKACSEILEDLKEFTDGSD